MTAINKKLLSIAWGYGTRHKNRIASEPETPSIEDSVLNGKLTRAEADSIYILRHGGVGCDCVPALVTTEEPVTTASAETEELV